MEKSLTIHSTSAIGHKFTKADLEIIEASKLPLIKTISDEHLITLATKVLSLAKFKLGLNGISAADEQANVLMLLQDIKDFPAYTEQDVLIATKRGLNGDYLKESETNVFFNSSNFVRWLKFYSMDKRQVIGMIQKTYVEQPPLPVPSDDQLRKQVIETLNDYIDTIKKNPDYKFPYGGLHHLYDIAKKFGIIQVEPEAKEKIWNRLNHISDMSIKITMAKSDSYIYFIHKMIRENMIVE
jgi:hypothetical protein